MATDASRKQVFIYDNEEMLEVFNQNAVNRKKALYWLGFLEGALASGTIETNEPNAIFEEAQSFANFFGDPDALDFIQDFNSKCFSSNEDMFDCIADISAEKFQQLIAHKRVSETDELNRFFGFCAGIICDGRVLATEAVAIRNRLIGSPVLGYDPSLKDLRSCVTRALSDGQLSQNELDEIREYLARLVGDGYADTGMSNIGSVAALDDLILDPARVNFIGRTFVITGPMRIGTRSQVVRLIEQAGGGYAGAPSRSTDYVVVAVSASAMWKTTHYGTKIERAREIAAKGASLAFLCESALEKALIDALGEV